MMGVSRTTLTWATIATAVVSALLLADAGGSIARIADAAGDAMRVRPDAAVSAGIAGQRSAAGKNAQRNAASVGDLSPR
ncbi:MAG: hypothetical protein M3R60_15300 [Pseudomonadota bacterium]|nr:hypothetical protein [Pseudomonadota bacterium]